MPPAVIFTPVERLSLLVFFRSCAAMVALRFCAVIAALVVLYPPPVLAQPSLGVLRLLAGPEEPMETEIEFTASKREGLRVQLASPSAYQFFGLNYNAGLAGVKLSIPRDYKGGTTNLHLLAQQPLAAPLDLLIEIRSKEPPPNHYRLAYYHLQYTALSQRAMEADPSAFEPFDPAHSSKLDLGEPQMTSPGYVSLIARRAPAPPLLTAQYALKPKPSAPQPKAAKPTPAFTLEPGSTYTVQAGDTVRKLGRAARRAPVGTNQMAAAIFRNNPNAFAEGQVGQLTVGSSVQIPTLEQAAAISPQEALEILGLSVIARQAAAEKPAPRAPQPQPEGSIITRKGEGEARDKLLLRREEANGKFATIKDVEQIRQQMERLSNNVAQLAQAVGELQKTASPRTNEGKAGGTTFPAPGASANPSAPAAQASPAQPSGEGGLLNSIAQPMREALLQGLSKLPDFGLTSLMRGTSDGALVGSVGGLLVLLTLMLRGRKKKPPKPKAT